MALPTATHCKTCNIELIPLNMVFCGGRQKNLCKICYNIKQKEWNKNNKGSKTTTRRNTTLGKYGLTIEEFDALAQAQGGVCAVCKRENNIEGRELSVDHDHETNQIRGLLCQKCNVALGLLGDDLELISALYAYVKVYRMLRVEEVS